MRRMKRYGESCFVYGDFSALISIKENIKETSYPMKRILDLNYCTGVVSILVFY